MKRTLALLVALAALLAATPAHAAKKPSCTRDGAKLQLTEGDVSVVSITPKAKGGDVPKDKVYACWRPTGKRTLVFTDYLSDESDTWDVIGGRYLGLYRQVEAGVAGYQEATSWDVRAGRAAFAAKGRCPSGEEESADLPKSALFYARGGIVYTCGDGSARMVDAKGDRLLEAGASAFAITADGHTLYYAVGDTLKSLGV